MSLSIPAHLSFSKTLSSQNHLFSPKPSPLIQLPRKSTVIRMGGGPRTYPGGVSKWQWKRMQKKKAKQLLKARLCRERQIYEMRKRAELKAAVSELERPWEVVEKAPKLFSVGADEQVKVLADRFQKPGGFDLWSERDGPQLFETPDGVPSARFFPKGVVHSVKPYGKLPGLNELADGMVNSGSESGDESKNDYESDGMSLNGESTRSVDLDLVKTEDRPVLESRYRKNSDGKLAMDRRNAKRNSSNYGKRGNRRRFGGGFDAPESGQDDFEKEKRVATAEHHAGGGSRINGGRNDSRINRNRGNRGLRNWRESKSEVYDMSLQQDGIYGIQMENQEYDF